MNRLLAQASSTLLVILLLGLGGSDASGAPRIHMDGVQHDPRLGFPAFPLLLEPSAHEGRPSLHFVQYEGPVRQAWVERLEHLGLEVLQYVPQSTFIVRATPAEAARAREEAFVLWCGPFPTALKLPPSLRKLAIEASGPASARARGLDVIIQLFEERGQDARAVGSFRRLLARAGGREISFARITNRVHLRAVVSAEMLAPLAWWPSVFRIEEFPRIILHGEREAVIAAGAHAPESLCVEPGYPDWLKRKGVLGEGIIVQVMDDGLEQGIADGPPGTAHADILERITRIDNATSDREGDCRSGHGSLNAGLIAGNAASGLRDAAGFLAGQGVSPGAKVFATKIFNNLGRFETGTRSFTDLVQVAAGVGATISSNSWGSSVFGEYDALAAEFDALSRDAHADSGDQAMTFIFAAGNEGDDVPQGEPSIGSPGTAKNVISVGASESCDGEGLDGCGVGPSGADSIHDVIQFSSRGPQVDGRLGPILVAPGTHVSGIASTAIDYDGAGICDPFWPQGQILYARASGTSHACPLVAGAVALFQESFALRTAVSPSPALTRAALVAAARDIGGGEDGFGERIASVPNNVEGWGLLSMEDLLADEGRFPAALYFDQQVVLDDSADVWETTAFPLDPNKPVKITLAWSDPPAMPGASPALVNDLDLEVESDGVIYLGNVFEAGRSASGGAPDALNNLECVFLPGNGSLMRIRVRARSIAGDGAPGGDGTDQDFALVVLGGTDQSSRGTVSFERSTYPCTGEVAVTVSDVDLKGRGSVPVSITSTGAPEPIIASLGEAGPGTGLFRGVLNLGKDPGQLQVINGSVITAYYADLDDGSGFPAEAIATASIDCIPPVVSEVMIGELTETGATLSWTTSEDATSQVSYGTECSVAASVISLERRLRSHSVTLTDLEPSTRYFFTISVLDLVKNGATDDRQGSCYSFHTSSAVCSFREDLESEPMGWTHSAEQGEDDWAPTTFRGAHSPTRAWHASGFDGSKDSSLVTPPLDISVSDRFSFWHTFQLERGYDGAVLEISTNDGRSWVDLGPHFIRGGYTDLVSGNPLGERMAWTGQRPESMTLVEADLSSWAGPARRIRFRIGTDSSMTDGFGWFVDDIALCHALNKRGEILFDSTVYPCSGRVRIELSDLDLWGLGQVEVNVSTTSHPEPVPFTLLERATGGVFGGEILLDGAIGVVPVMDGDSIEATYVDEDNGLGDPPHSLSASARADCRAPVISHVRVIEVLDDQATIAWETDEPAIGELTAGLTCGATTIRRAVAMGGTTHAVTIDSLLSSRSYYFQILASDEAGNSAVDNAGGACRLLRPADACTARHSFDDGAPGWTHSALLGKDAWSLESIAFARTPPGAWFLPGADEFADVSLFSPALFIPAGGYLSFWHSFEFETGFDGALIELSLDRGETWIDLGPSIRRGSYNGTLVPPNPLAGRKAWTGWSLGPMTRVIVDLGPWARRLAWVRFRAASDASVGGKGWYIDQIELCQAVREEAQLSLDREAYRCEGEIGVQLLDTGRAGRTNTNVDVSSTSAAGPQRLVLSEVVPGSGIFEGRISITTAAAPGALLVKSGDDIQVLYRDEDDGSGMAREVTASRPVDCAAPKISNVAVESIAADSAVISWSTSEEAVGRVEVGRSCGAFDQVTTADAPSTLQRVVVTGLSPGTTHFFQVVAIDKAENSVVDDAAGSCHRFRTHVTFLHFGDDLEPMPEFGWDRAGRWQVAESDLARSPTHVWRIDGDGTRSDAALTLPVLSAGPDSVLELWHTFTFADRLTGGLIEASSDGGLTWVDLEPGILEGGYSAFLLPGSPAEGRRAWTGGTLGPMSRVRVRLGDVASASADREVLIRLRWVSQGIGVEGSWLLDDIRCHRSVGETGFVGFGKFAYRCGATGTVRVADAGRTGTGTVIVEMTSTSQPVPLIVAAQEVLPGLFEGSFPLKNVDTPTALLARDGDVITGTYRDDVDQDGKPRIVIGAVLVDCAPPRISRVRFGGSSVSSVEVLWETSEPARGRIFSGEACESLLETASSGALRTSHVAMLGGLGPDRTTFFSVEAQDAAGNVSTGTPCLEVSLARDCVFEDSLEPPAAEWSHSAVTGTDNWEVVEFEHSRSPTHSFFAPNPGEPRDSALVTPPVDVGEGGVLSFWHTFDFEAGFDGALLEVSTDGGAVWSDLGPRIFEGGYNGGIVSTRDDILPAWTGGGIGDMTRVSVVLDGLEGQARRFRFRILCDESVGSPGWFIDDVSVCSFQPDAGRGRFVRGNCNSDASLNLSDAIFLLGFLFSGGSEPACLQACDMDGSGALNLTDAVYILEYLFRGGSPPPPPNTCAAILDSEELECASDSCTEP
ncbi:MAG TPA: S8 family serine peptidase [Planctomycetota bacterium]|nr:S8 family serine peptidase [Planctomycetota bacterium]